MDHNHLYAIRHLEDIQAEEVMGKAVSAPVALENDVLSDYGIRGRVAGYASSALVELCGLLATIFISPRNALTLDYTDDSSVVHNKTARRRDTGLWKLDPQKHLEMLCHTQFAGRTHG
ncbi:hypothetical protein BGZ49_002838 [Haplosporangium sp. Z 27]|nr:hypothetical protein BGZ49_002838 [Haplosporangium sp. Z 27]